MGFYRTIFGSSIFAKCSWERGESRDRKLGEKTARENRFGAGGVDAGCAGDGVEVGELQGGEPGEGGCHPSWRSTTYVLDMKKSGRWFGVRSVACSVERDLLVGLVLPALAIREHVNGIILYQCQALRVSPMIRNRLRITSIQVQNILESNPFR